VDIG
jgi:hypothetical protein